MRFGIFLTVVLSYHTAIPANDTVTVYPSVNFELDDYNLNKSIQYYNNSDWTTSSYNRTTTGIIRVVSLPANVNTKTPLISNLHANWFDKMFDCKGVTLDMCKDSAFRETPVWKKACFYDQSTYPPTYKLCETVCQSERFKYQIMCENFCSGK